MNSCDCLEWKPRKRTKSNGSIVVAKQCTACGRSLGELPKAAHNLNTLEPWDDALVQSTTDRRIAQFKLARELNAAKMGEWWEAYHRYLDSDHWRFLRAKVLRRDPICEACFNQPSTQAHHVSYESFKKIGCSFSIECVGVCESCHNRIHQKESPDANA